MRYQQKVFEIGVRVETTRYDNECNLAKEIGKLKLKSTYRSAVDQENGADLFGHTALAIEKDLGKIWYRTKSVRNVICSKLMGEHSRRGHCINLTSNKNHYRTCFASAGRLLDFCVSSLNIIIWNSNHDLRETVCARTTKSFQRLREVWGLLGEV